MKKVFLITLISTGISLYADAPNPAVAAPVASAAPMPAPAAVQPKNPMAQVMDLSQQFQEALKPLQDASQDMAVQKAVQDAIQAAATPTLISKSFAHGIDSIRHGLEEIVQEGASNVVLCDELHELVNTTLDAVTDKFNELIKDGKVPTLPGSSHIASVLQSILQGATDGIKGAKTSGKCPFKLGNTSSTAAVNVPAPVAVVPPADSVSKDVKAVPAPVKPVVAGQPASVPPVPAEVK